MSWFQLISLLVLVAALLFFTIDSLTSRISFRLVAHALVGTQPRVKTNDDDDNDDALVVAAAAAVVVLVY